MGNSPAFLYINSYVEDWTVILSSMVPFILSVSPLFCDLMLTLKIQSEERSLHQHHQVFPMNFITLNTLIVLILTWKLFQPALTSPSQFLKFHSKMLERLEGTVDKTRTSTEWRGLRSRTRWKNTLKKTKKKQLLCCFKRQQSRHSRREEPGWIKKRSDLPQGCKWTIILSSWKSSATRLLEWRHVSTNKFMFKSPASLSSQT